MAEAAAKTNGTSVARSDEADVVKTNEALVALLEKNITDVVFNRVKKYEAAGGIRIPPDYSPENALRSAWLILQETKDRNDKPVLVSCTKDSIASSLFEMITQGLNPMKKQCYFIAYGNRLSCQRSYMGTVALSKRFGGVTDVKAQAVYKDDEFEFEIDCETGEQKIIRHKQSLESIDGELKGAYAIVYLADGTKHTEIMTAAQIRKAWEQGQAKGNSKAHQNFSGEMAKKTVIGRACKLFINTSSDAALFTDDDNDDDTRDAAVIVSQRAIAEGANRGEVISFNPQPKPAAITESISAPSPAPAQQKAAEPPVEMPLPDDLAQDSLDMDPGF